MYRQVESWRTPNAKFERTTEALIIKDNLDFWEGFNLIPSEGRGKANMQLTSLLFSWQKRVFCASAFSCLSDLMGITTEKPNFCATFSLKTNSRRLPCHLDRKTFTNPHFFNQQFKKIGFPFIETNVKSTCTLVGKQGSVYEGVA